MPCASRRLGEGLEEQQMVVDGERARVDARGRERILFELLRGQRRVAIDDAIGELPQAHLPVEAQGSPLVSMAVERRASRRDIILHLGGETVDIHIEGGKGSRRRPAGEEQEGQRALHRSSRNTRPTDAGPSSLVWQCAQLPSRQICERISERIPSNSTATVSGYSRS